MCMSLSNNKRWGPAKRALAAQGVVVHFQERDDVYNYVGAYMYVCKSDRNVLHSNPHPDLSNVTQYRTAAASAANRRGARNRNGTDIQRTDKLTNLKVMMIIRTKGIKDDTALLAIAEDNFNEGHTALMEFIANTPEVKYKALITKTWKIAEAKANLQRMETTRIEKLHNA